MNKGSANILLIFVTIIWGGGFIATDYALQAFSPFYVMMIRFIGAGLLSLLLCFKKLKTLTKEEWKKGIFVGGLLFFAFAFQTFGLKYSTPSKNAFLTATNVIFIPYFLYIIKKRKPNMKEVLASIICMIGIGCLTLNDLQFNIGLGDLLSIICAIFFALHIIYLADVSKQSDTLCLTTIQLLTSGILSSIFALCLETMPNSIDKQGLLSVGYCIIFSSFLAYFIQTYAQKYTSANSASLILSMEALFASFFSFILLHEEFSLRMIFGAMMIFLSIIFIEYKKK